MRFATPFFAALLATPALAHPGAHIHPHAGDPSWLVPLASALLVVAAGTLAWVKSR